MDDKLKWFVAAGGLGMLGYALWGFVSESAKVSNRPRQPWEEG
jgi:hypothetical protein